MKYPSVTEIIEATKTPEQILALKKWRERVGIEEAERISKEAILRGNNYDKMVQDHINNIVIPHKKFEQFLYCYQIQSTEQKIISEKHKYRGRYDALVKDQFNNFIIVDFKGTTKRKRREWISDYFCQLSAYWNAISEVGIKINHGIILTILENEIEPFYLNEDEMKYYFTLFLLKKQQFENQSQ